MFKPPSKHYVLLLLASLFTLSSNVLAESPEENALALPVCVNGRCTAVDQNGNLLMPFDNRYSNVIAANYKNTIFAGKQGMWHLVSADGKTVLKANISKQLTPLTPNYFRIDEDGKAGIIRSDGKRIAAPRYDYIHVEHNNPYMVYGLKGKQGLLNAHGEKITEARFDSILSRNSATEHASLAIARNDDGRLWLINLKTRQVIPTTATSLEDMEDGHLVAKSRNGLRTGLVNQQGQVVIDIEYVKLGLPSGGLVSFQREYNEPCGYLDYQGKVVIAAQFSECLPFGQKEALVRERHANPLAGKFGPINRQGAWVRPPSYDKADLSGQSIFGIPTPVPGLLSIAKVDEFATKFGLYDTNEGKEIIPMQYQWVAAISPDWFAYSDDDSPQVKVHFLRSEALAPAQGIMDRMGKALVAPSGFVYISLDPSGHFFRAWTGIDKKRKIGLYDLNGNLIIPPNWEMLNIDHRHGVIQAYARIDDTAENNLQALYALHNMQGKLLLSIRTLVCGAQQAIDSAGAVIWPEDPEQYCTQRP
ncbi:hypothetical protein DBR37_13950 [Herminiimonas sp. KBW02]|uniref:WG repeat-containing protein n=1 Tax=Herminiimonas sp. KBW02 TaxID=2153363 RepID=UPI000F5B219D|nr:WG repeat-containing protein [Herminiimonas sp. KBW02]RQO33309.1 hypothetical protein DBR37_13950 [Herminiimonas sp. KBW02]